MNKDLDDRLLPEGEYRDAQNIEVLKCQSAKVSKCQSIKVSKYQSIKVSKYQRIKVGSIELVNICLKNGADQDWSLFVNKWNL